MLNKITQRPLTAKEQKFLEDLLLSAPTMTQHWQKGASNALVLWAASMLVFFMAWAGVAWVVRKLFHQEYGWYSQVAPETVVTAVLASAVFAIVSSVRWVRQWQDPRPLIEADLAAGLAMEEHYRFDANKRFQEPEHGGLLYFLRTTEGKVLTLFDGMSQDLGVQGENPFNSSFAPRHELLLVRAPATRYVMNQQFSGELLPQTDALPLNIAPELWPEPDEFCETPWDELENRLSNLKR